MSLAATAWATCIDYVCVCLCFYHKHRAMLIHPALRKKHYILRWGLNEIKLAAGIVLKGCFSTGLLNERLFHIKERVDPLFTFYRGNLGLFKAVNLHGNSSFWNFPHLYKFASQLSCSQTCSVSFPCHWCQIKSWVKSYCSLC